MLTRRHTSYWLAGLTVALVAAVAILGRQRIAEHWYIHQLGSDDHAVVDQAALRLGEMKSVRAVESLAATIHRQLDEAIQLDGTEKDRALLHAVDCPALAALVSIGGTETFEAISEILAITTKLSVERLDRSLRRVH